MTTRLYCWIVCLLALLCAVPAAAQKSRFKIAPGPKPGGGEVKWSVGPTGTIEMEKDEYAVLERDVNITYQDIHLRADKVTYNLKTKDAVAEGNVIIDQGPTRVAASHAVFNLESKTGTFFKAIASMEPSLSFSGDQIEKVGDTTYRLTNGVFTSCDLDRPAWSFRIGNAQITLDDYAHMQNVSFRARRIPLFWTPRLIWPTKRDRSQGFLIPRLVFGDLGTRLETAYYVPFGQSVDATLMAALNTEGYFGGGLNFRYLPSPNVKIGEFTGSVVRDPNPEARLGETAPRGVAYRWRYRYQHSQDNLPGGFRGVVDLENFSNLDFFRRYENEPRLHTLSNVYSSAYLTKNRSRYSLNLLTDRRELLFTTREQRFEQMPSLQLRMYPQRVAATPLYFSMESSASHLRMNALDRLTVENRSHADYMRADIFPTLSLQVRTPAWFSIRPQVSMRETYYSASVGEGDNPAAPLNPLDQSVSRFYAQGQVELVGPSVSRIFNRGVGNFTRFKHVLEPRFRYIYTTDVSDQDKIIRFDTVDSPYLPIVRDSVEYSLTQRLIGKESGPNGAAREVMSFSLRQTASLSKRFTSGTGGTPGDFSPAGDQKFTPLVATLRFNPYQAITVDANTTFGSVSHQVDQASFSANLIGTGKNADKYLGLTWFASFLPPGQTSGDSSGFRVNTGSSIIKDKLRADVQLNYDAKTGQFLDQHYLMGVTGSCYGITIGVRQFTIYTPLQRTQWRAELALNLKNVGTFGSAR